MPGRLFFMGTVALVVVALLLTVGCASLHPTGCKGVQKDLSSEEFSTQVMQYGSGASVKALIIMPPTGGTTILDRGISENFCKAGYDVYLISDWTGSDEKAMDVGLHERLFERAQAAISLVLAEIKSSRVGILGTSVGGLHSVVSAESQDRIEAIFVIGAGVPIPEVIVKSDLGSLKELLKNRKEGLGFKSDSEVINAITENFKFEPTLLGEKFKTKTRGMMIFTNDKTVPYANQEKLREFWQPTYVKKLKAGHLWGIIRSALFHVQSMIDFFDKVFAEESKQE